MNGYRSIFRAGMLDGHTIIITGGGTGIGRAIAHETAALGAHVVLAARRTEPLEQTLEEIEAAGGRASFHPCNIRHESDIEALWRWVLNTRGAIYGLVNNAGGQFLSPAEAITGKGWEAVLSTNLTGTFLMCRQGFATYFRAHGGVIVNIVAEMWRGFPGMAHTGAARAGVVNLTRTLAVEWARYGIRVNAVAPGIIAGSGLEHYGAEALPFIEQARREIPLKRLGSESEVAAVTTFLLSPAAAYISGETVRVDGAGSLWRKTWDIPDHDRAPAVYDGFNMIGGGSQDGW